MPAPLGKFSNVLSAETIDILLSKNGGSDGVLGNVAWKGQLDKNTVNGMVIVLLVDLLEQLCLGDICGEMNKFAKDASLLDRYRLGCLLKIIHDVES